MVDATILLLLLILTGIIILILMNIAYIYTFFKIRAELAPYIPIIQKFINSSL